MKRQRLDLMDKVSFFAGAGGTDYNLIYHYKDKRDDVAHGKYTSGINIPGTLVDMKRLYNDLKALITCMTRPQAAKNQSLPFANEAFEMRSQRSNAG
ncbi:MAG TPA: hypothetical protein VI423_11980 [Paenisporosarcina sp.]|nr:hypothetical protein [Paenisporosarcina sp.]